MLRIAITITEPISAPTTAAVMPSTKALMEAFLAILFKIWRRYYCKHITGKKCSNACNGRSRETSNQISNKSDCYYNRTRRDHSHRNSIHKLFFSKPMIFINHSAMQEGNDGEAAPKNQSTRFQKKQTNLTQYFRLIVPNANSCKKKN